MVLKICSDIALKFCMSFLCREPRRDSRYRRESRHTQSRLVLEFGAPSIVSVLSRSHLGLVEKLRSVSISSETLSLSYILILSSTALKLSPLRTIFEDG